MRKLIILLAILASGCQANRGVMRIDKVEINLSINPNIGTEFSPSR